MSLADWMAIGRPLQCPVNMDGMDPDEQIRIERELRQKLTKPSYPPIFDLPQARIVKSREPVSAAVTGVERCRSEGRAEEITGGWIGGNGIVDRHAVSCVLEAGHPGPHVTESINLVSSKKLGHW
jgi:hypothetical protein